MTRAGERNGWLVPSIPYIELGGASTPIALDTGWNDTVWSFIYFQTSDFEYRDDGTIHVYTTGLYRIDYEIAFKLVANGNSSTIQLQILNNGVKIEDSASIGRLYCDGSTTDYLSLSVSRTVYLHVDDNVSFQFNVSNKTTLTIADVPGTPVYYSRVRISYIPLGGFNNNSGGNIINRGIRR